MNAETKKRSRVYAAIAAVSFGAAITAVWISVDRLNRATDPKQTPISVPTDIGGRPARYDDKAKVWVLTDERDLTVEEPK